MNKKHPNCDNPFGHAMWDDDKIHECYRCKELGLLDENSALQARMDKLEADLKFAMDYNEKADKNNADSE